MPIYQVKTNIPVIIINSYIFILLDTTWHTSVFVSTLFLQILQASYFLFRCSFHNPATRFFMIGIPTCIVQFSLFLWFDEHKKLTWLIWILASCEFYIYIFHNWIFFFFHRWCWLAFDLTASSRRFYFLFVLFPAVRKVPWPCHIYPYYCRS